MYERLKKLCAAHGTNITQLCEKVTGSSGNLATWKKGYMRSDYLLKVSEYLDVSADYLVGRSEKSSGELSSIDEELKYLLDLYQKLHEDDKIRIITKMETIIEDYPENKESVS
ncbi:MAG: helix-turn-helix domain-containing protein [Oscillospiraceae bacterium]